MGLMASDCSRSEGLGFSACCVHWGLGQAFFFLIYKFRGVHVDALYFKCTQELMTSVCQE
jgi:hypothetical protein